MDEAHPICPYSKATRSNIEVTVNLLSAGLPGSTRPSTARDRGLQSEIAINLACFFHITQCVAAEMLKQNSGNIVSITTSLVDHAIAGVPTVLANLTKVGINSATEALDIEYSSRGIRVNVVSPGIIRTPMHAAASTRSLTSNPPAS